jgi:hypothetical protein
MAMLALDGIEARGDASRAVLVTGEEDVLGQIARAESDVVLPFSRWERDAGVRARQDQNPRSLPLIDRRSADHVPRA